MMMMASALVDFIDHGLRFIISKLVSALSGKHVINNGAKWNSCIQQKGNDDVGVWGNMRSSLKS